MLAALGGGLLLVKQNQNTQRGAYFAGTKLLMQPQALTGSVGGEVVTQLWAETEKIGDVVKPTPTPRNDGNCGAKPAEKCGVWANEGWWMLQVRPECINGKWDFNDQVCTKAGRKDVCGGQNYCCPGAIGTKWTTNMSSCPTSPPLGGDAKLSSIDTVVCYGSNLELTNPGIQVSLNEEVLKDVIDASLINVDGRTCLRLIAISGASMKPEDLKGGMISLATIRFKAVSPGSGKVEILADQTKVGGYNPTVGATDAALKVGTVTEATYTIGGEVGDVPILNYKVSFGDVKVADAKCAVNWPLQIIVLGAGETKVYSDVTTQAVSSSGSLITYKGSLPLVGFDHLINVAAFIKGPKHLQMKYAVQNQSASYDKAGGELTLTKSAESSVLYDFSKYPMLPGDVVGATIEVVPNGVIDGVDFAYVKSRSLTHETVAEGGNLKGDLDGNCQVNTNDVTVLKKSLETKQGELY